jgi:hypothetical protein
MTYVLRPSARPRSWTGFKCGPGLVSRPVGVPASSGLGSAAIRRSRCPVPLRQSPGREKNLRGRGGPACPFPVPNASVSICPLQDVPSRMSRLGAVSRPVLPSSTNRGWVRDNGASGSSPVSRPGNPISPLPVAGEGPGVRRGTQIQWACPVPPGIHHEARIHGKQAQCSHRPNRAKTKLATIARIAASR